MRYVRTTQIVYPHIAVSNLIAVADEYAFKRTEVFKMDVANGRGIFHARRPTLYPPFSG